MKRLKIFLKWTYLRWLVSIDKRAYKKRKLNIDERLIKNVLIKIVSNPKNLIIICPLSKTIYLQTENKDYTIVLGTDIIKITNHKIFIETSTDFFFNKELFEIVYHYVEKYRINLDKELFNNEINSLNYMLNQLNQNENEIHH